MMRRSVAMGMILAVAAIAAPAIIHPLPRLIWNASASVPIGFYMVQPADRPRRGNLVVLMPPTPLAEFLAARDYLPRGVPLIKYVAAGPGEKVCRSGLTVTVDGAAIGDALTRDRLGRTLPIWQGCRRITDDEIFLMNPSVCDSFDGRYTGPIPRQSIIGLAVPLWTDERGDGHLQLPAAAVFPPPHPTNRSFPCP